MVLSRFGMVLVLARRHHRRRYRRRFSWGPEVSRRVSVIVPACNEKECIANTLESLARSTHPIEVIVVDDGSTDGTSEIARETAARLGMGNVRVVRQHRKSLTDKGPSGRFGRVGMPLVVLFQIVTPVFAPLIDVFTVYSMVFVDLRAALVDWFAVLGVQLLCAAYAFRHDRERCRYLWMMPLQQLAYRQMMYLVLIHACAGRS